jgi:xanthine dehydrogenase accessory factor
MAKHLKLAPVQREAPIVAPASALEVLEVAAARARSGISGALATVIGRRGSAPSTPGQKLYLGADGTCLGTVGGGAVEREVVSALDAIVTKKAEKRHGVRSFALGAELGMCCGGGVDVLLESIESLAPCLIVGAGHVATATAPVLSRVGFAVTVVDCREEWTHEGRIEGVRVLLGEYDEVGRELPLDGAVLVMTHDHALDQEVIEWALKRGFAFVGGVGSRAKALRTRARLEAKGFAEADRERVRMPLGLGIGARLPAEIAVSIAAELVQWRRSRSA